MAINHDERPGFLSPVNLIDAVQNLASKADDDFSKQNIGGQIFYTMIAAYVFGNSMGTANTKNGRKRLNVGPVYIW